MLLTRARFRHWRGGRPFWGGAWTVLAGGVLVLVSSAPLPLLVHQGVAGVSGYLMGLLLVTAGLLGWAQPAHRLLLGVLATLVSLASLVTSNLGGFGLATALGTVGGALLIAWQPAGPRTGGGQPARTGDRPARSHALVAVPLALLLVDGSAQAAHTPGRPQDSPAIPGARTAPAPLPPSTTRARLTADRIVLTRPRLHGVTRLPGQASSRRYLAMSMKRVSLDGGAHLSGGAGATFGQRFSAMTLSGDVLLYATRVQGRVLGVELTFTPDLPPPLLTPSMTITDVTIDQPSVQASAVRIDALRQHTSTGRPETG